MDQGPSSASETPYHRPVMVDQVVEIFAAIPDGLLVDATFGGGGHSRALLGASPDRSVLALDRDPDAAAQVPEDPRLRFVVANFADLEQVVQDLMAEASGDSATRRADGGAVDGVLFDLGVSSHQLDDAGRGFSYRQSGPLDMRMGPDATRSAADLVERLPSGELARIIRRYGEERFASRIAAAIVGHRPFATTEELADVIAGAVPAAARRRRHPARKVFQAIRIAVNDELSALERGLDAAIRRTRPGGRIVVIAYHSLEDRIVKRRFTAGASDCECPPDFPVCICGRAAELRLLARKGLRPSPEEVAGNPRSRSAILRAVEVLGPTPDRGGDAA